MIEETMAYIFVGVGLVILGGAVIIWLWRRM